MTTTAPDPVPDDGITGELAFAAPIIPLQSAVRDRMNREVKLHLPGMGVGGGAIEVEGRITRYSEDDATVTVVDADAEYDVPLHRIGIIESKR